MQLNGVRADVAAYFFDDEYYCDGRVLQDRASTQRAMGEVFRRRCENFDEWMNTSIKEAYLGCEPLKDSFLVPDYE